MSNTTLPSNQPLPRKPGIRASGDGACADARPRAVHAGRASSWGRCTCGPGVSELRRMGEEAAAGPPARRWFVERLRVKGLKSFHASADIQLPSSHLVGIVGKNGAGKSTLLDAIAFAAGCTPGVLGVRQLQELQSTVPGAALPEVELTVAASPTQAHTVHACLTPDGGRAYRIDGRARTAQQLKDFLRDKGILISDHASTSIIRQAQVTALADTNSPKRLADVIASASGLARWAAESAKASAEVERTRRALQDIDTNVDRLRCVIAGDESKFQAAARRQQLLGEMAEAAQQLLYNLQQQQRLADARLTHCAAQTAQAEALLAREQAAAAAAAEQHDAAAAELEEAQQQLESGCMNDGIDAAAGPGSAAGGSVVADVMQRVAVAEAQLELWRTNLAEAQELRGWLQRGQSRLAALRAEALEAGQLLALQAGQVQQLQSVLGAGASSSAAGGDGGDLAARCLQQLQAAAEEWEGRLADLEAGEQQAAKELEALQQQLSQEQAEEPKLSMALSQHKLWLQEVISGGGGSGAAAGIGGGSSCGADELMQAALQHKGEELQQARRQLAQAAMQLAVAEASLPGATALCSGAAGTRANGGADPQQAAAVPLHQRFTFAAPLRDSQPAAGPTGAQTAIDDGGDAAKWLRPLAVIAGNALGSVMVVNTVQEAADLLDAAARTSSSGGRNRVGVNSNAAVGGGGRIRVWPLERLEPLDAALLARQRAAQTRLGAGAVALPLDMLRYPPRFERAVARAFSRYVIAADAPTAARLVREFGLSSVTMDGTVSRVGLLSGGWSGARPPQGQLLLQHKLKADALRAQLASQQASVARLQAEYDAAAQRHGAFLAAAAEVEAAEAALQRCRQQVDALKGKVSTCQAALECHTSHVSHAAAQLARQQALLAEMMPQEEAKGQQREQQAQRGGGACIDRVKQELSRALEAERQLAQRQEAAAAAADVLAAELEAAEVRAGALQDVPALEAAIQDKEVELHSLQAQLAVMQEHEHAAAAQVARLQAAVAELDTTQAARAKQVVQAERAQQQAASAQQAAQQALDAVSADIAAVCAANQELLGSGEAAVAASGEQGGAEAAAAAGGAAGPDDMRKLAAAATKLKARLSGLRKERAKLQAAGQVAAADEAQYAERTSLVVTFQEQASMLRAASDLLEEGVWASTQDALAANAELFDAASSKFSGLCAELLPNLQLRLEKADQGGGSSDVSECGAVMQFRRLPAAAADSGSAAGGKRPSPPAAAAAQMRQHQNNEVGSERDECGTTGGWSSSLEQLSGGQRTLVSLALLLAAAQAGGHSTVLLMDEIDAALDEHNQRIVAQLLRELCHSQGCQIIAVTHNPAFQATCDALVTISKDPVTGSKAQAPIRTADPAGAPAAGGDGAIVASGKPPTGKRRHKKKK